MPISFVRLSLARRFVLLSATVVVGTLLAACSSDSTGPRTNQTIALMAHLDSLRVASSPDSESERRTQLAGAITLLALGAPVHDVQITTNSSTVTYSSVAAFEVTDDIEGTPADSAFTIVAWTGDAADTLVTLEVFHQASGLVFSAGSVVLGSSGATGTATAQAPNGTCTSLLDHLPPDVTVPPGITCQLETTTATATGNFNGGTFTLPSQTIKGIRIEGQTGGG
ncbi:MAG TPA: hypothetical protein VL157_12570 [Gemmatimonadaceae bacterium]|jgi:hypothetical protein|nr:hypothetical protein [Gemmatimonadaceae bacterium]